MVLARKLCVLVLGCCILGAQALSEDPVLKARNERAKAQGISEGDLPPVPRGIVEPPPLPPPETHVKDTRGGRVAKARPRKHGKGSKAARTELASKTAKPSKAGKSPKSGTTSKHPAKGGRKSSKRVKV